MIKTFRYQDFLPYQRVIELKKKNNAVISVVIPTKNEEKTIGNIVTILNSLKNEVKLIDEIIVMDCSSEDSTVNIAKNCGATVVLVDTLEPMVEASGKGVALWKSQFVSSGDIVVFIDADILDFSERFVVGLAGALLANKELGMVKASYRRPLISGKMKIDDSGGRVTELLVRPLINMFLPELSDIRQPLAGEYALRRTTLETLPVYSGYGVDIGLLLAQFSVSGIDSIGEVEMGIRTHRNRSLYELTKMAFEIEHVFFNFIEQTSNVGIIGRRNRNIKTWEKDHWSSYQIQDTVLPSIINR